MGRWFVAANVPTYFEVDKCNCIEDYTWNEAKQCIDVAFSMQASRKEVHAGITHMVHAYL